MALSRAAGASFRVSRTLSVPSSCDSMRMALDDAHEEEGPKQDGIEEAHENEYNDTPSQGCSFALWLAARDAS